MLRIYSPQDRVPIDDVRKLCLEIRERKKWSQEQLARHLGVSKRRIEDIEQRVNRTVDKEFADLLKRSV